MTRATRPRREDRIARLLSRLLAALLFVSLAALAWLMLVYPAADGPGAGREVRIAIARDASLEDVLSQLGGGVVASPTVFALYARLAGADERLREGEVLLRDDMSPRTVLLRIALGFGAASVDVVVPEGVTRFEVADRLHRWGICDRDAFLAATTRASLLDELGIRAPSLEGRLFPDTYRLVEGSDAVALARRMERNFVTRTASLLTPDALAPLADLDFDAEDVLTLASIVEEEAAVPEERAIIAGVFLNRLRSETFLPRHRLQADPTVSYGCRELPALAPSCLGFDGRRITRAMLEDAANPYNTYRHGGLPPGPIASPGLAAIRAVLEPEAHDYLYFVARGGGRHTFSSDLDAHNAAVARLRARERGAEAEGEASEGNR